MSTTQQNYAFRTQTLCPRSLHSRGIPTPYIVHAHPDASRSLLIVRSSNALLFSPFSYFVCIPYIGVVFLEALALIPSRVLAICEHI